MLHLVPSKVPFCEAENHVVDPNTLTLDQNHSVVDPNTLTLDPNHSVVDPNTLTLDPNPEFSPNLDPDPGLCYEC